MKPMYDYFNGDLGLYEAAGVAFEILKRELNPASDMSALYDRLVSTLGVLKDGLTGDMSWATLGKYIGDLAIQIAGFFPQARFADIVSALWEASKVL